MTFQLVIDMNSLEKDVSEEDRERVGEWVGEKGHAVFVLFSVGHPFKQLYAFLGIGSSGGTALGCTSARGTGGSSQRYVRFT